MAPLQFGEKRLHHCERFCRAILLAVCETLIKLNSTNNFAWRCKSLTQLDTHPHRRRRAGGLVLKESDLGCERVAGKVERKVGDVKKVFGK
jgi:hypothetical protein